jgi:hypothetical protein
MALLFTSITSADNLENSTLSLCILNNLKRPDPVQIISEVETLQEAAQLLRASAERKLTPDEVKEVRRVERIRKKDRFDLTIGNEQVRDFYRRKSENTAKIINAEIQYRRAEQTAFDLDVPKIVQATANHIKEIGVELRTPIKTDFIHLTDIIDGLRAAHGQEQTYNNEDIAQYLIYEATSADLHEAKLHQKEPEWKERIDQLEQLDKNLSILLSPKLRRNPNVIGIRILQGCCHLGCGRCFYGAVRDAQPNFNPGAAQQTELPLYKALELVRPFISAIDSANPDWVAGKNKNLR